MSNPWYVKFLWWLCSKTGHIGAHGWIYNNQYHRDCKLCGSIITEDLK